MSHHHVTRQGFSVFSMPSLSCSCALLPLTSHSLIPGLRAMGLSRQLSVLAAVCTLAWLLASATARPSKEDLINEVKAAKEAINDPKMNGRYKSSVTFLDHLVPIMETDWNPPDAYLANTEGKTVLLPDDTAIASAAPDAVTTFTKSKFKRGDVTPYGNWIRANILDGVYEEDDLKTAKGLKNANGRSVGTEEVLDSKSGRKKVTIGKGKAKIKEQAIFRGKLFIIHGVDAVQPRE
ncbi:unnamed protein product [Closterium sp. Naga37s-1]|nr:unnamed protein product [Closterium sp. Naga37s-1]